MQHFQVLKYVLNFNYNDGNAFSTFFVSWTLKSAALITTTTSTSFNIFMYYYVSLSMHIFSPNGDVSNDHPKFVKRDFSRIWWH